MRLGKRQPGRDIDLSAAQGEMVLFADGVVDVHVRQATQVLQDEGFIPAAVVAPTT